MKYKSIFAWIVLLALFSCKSEVEPKNIVNNTLAGTLWVHIQGEEVVTGKVLATAYWFFSDGIVYEFPIDEKTTKGSLMHRCSFQRKNKTVTISKDFNTEIGTLDGDIMKFGYKEYFLSYRELTK